MKYLTVKKNEVLVQVTTWINLENMIHTLEKKACQLNAIYRNTTKETQKNDEKRYSLQTARWCNSTRETQWTLKQALLEIKGDISQ